MAPFLDEKEKDVEETRDVFKNKYFSIV